jgi:DNA polymerase-1
MASIVGMEKDDSVDKYIKENKLYTIEDIPTRKDPDKLKHYDQVPFDIITQYGATDAIITHKLGIKLINKIAEYDSAIGNKYKIKDVLKTERELIPVLMDMRDVGVLVDVDYVNEAFNHTVNEYKKAEQLYTDLTGIAFRDANATHAKAFKAAGLKFPLTAKGNPSFTDEVLTSMDSELAQALQDYRYGYKKAHTYFANFLHLRDSKDLIHCELNQATGRTGRFSSSNPNLQNLNRPRKDEQYLVRRSFIPQPDHAFFMLDFDQFEYRAMLNKAGEMGVIEQVLGGLDVHTATANLMGVERQLAKTINFLLLYGGGYAVLARALYKTHLSEDTLKLIQKYHWDRDRTYSMSSIAGLCKLDDWEVIHGVEILEKAKANKELYFKKLPRVKKYVQDTTKKAERVPIYNYFGRRYTFPKAHAYKAPNYEIQGETADWIKQAMVSVHQYLKPKKSNLILQVHDELLFQIHKNEFDIVYDLKDIMENIAPTTFLPYTVGIDFSDKSWADKRKYKHE